MTDLELTAASDVEPVTDAWSAYLTAAQRLDAVRRADSSTVAEQAQNLQAARAELAGVRARLAPQRARLSDLGVPDGELTPTAADLAAAASTMAGDPAAVLSALHGARATADAADAVTVAGAPGARLGSGPWLRNLLVYGPFATVVLVVQIVLYLVAGEGALPTYALLCGLTMPVIAFGLGWLTIGLVFPASGNARVDRTPLLGIAVCLAPIVLTCLGVGVLAVAR